jgi:hypothetical protein
MVALETIQTASIARVGKKPDSSLDEELHCPGPHLIIIIAKRLGLHGYQW